MALVVLVVCPISYHACTGQRNLCLIAPMFCFRLPVRQFATVASTVALSPTVALLSLRFFGLVGENIYLPSSLEKDKRYLKKVTNVSGSRYENTWMYL